MPECRDEAFSAWSAARGARCGELAADGGVSSLVHVDDAAGAAMGAPGGASGAVSGGADLRGGGAPDPSVSPVRVLMGDRSAPPSTFGQPGQCGEYRSRQSQQQRRAGDRALEETARLHTAPTPPACRPSDATLRRYPQHDNFPPPRHVTTTNNDTEGQLIVVAGSPRAAIPSPPPRSSTPSRSRQPRPSGSPGVQDRDGARPLLWNLRKAFPSVRLTWATANACQHTTKPWSAGR